MSDRPNIVFVLGDQMRASAMGCAGNDQIQTPTLDRLAEEGVHFERAYTPDPVCSPARASILTSQYPHRHGVVENNLRLDTRDSLAHCLQNDGYATGYVGKWHLDGTPKPGQIPSGERRQGFEFWRGFNRGHRYHDGHPHFEDGTVHWEGGYQPALQTEMAQEFISEHAGEQPFFCFLSWGPPHTPFDAPDEYSPLYDPDELALRPNVPDAADTGELRTDLAEYYALVTSLDDQLSRLLATLDEQGIADDTVVVFTSDHGEMLGSLGRYRKGYPFEESIHVPLLVRYPGAFNTQSTDAIVNLIDLAPTVLELVGIPIPEHMQGRDFGPLLRGNETDAFDETYIEGQLTKEEAWCTIRTDRYMLTVDRALDIRHLYDTVEDPFQLNNRAGDPDVADVQGKLFDRLTEQFERFEDRQF